MNRKAIALIFTFAVAAVLATLGAAVVSRSVSESHIAQRYLRDQQSFWLAEAGIQRALWELNYGDGSWPGWTDISGDKSMTVTLGSVGDYYVEVGSPTSANPQISTFGYAPSVSDSNRIIRGLEADVSSGGASLFRYAAFGRSSVYINGNGQTDSYDSSLGPYGNTNQSTNGDVGTNGTSADVVTLRGNATVYGDVSTGEGGTIKLTGNASIDGAQSHDTNETLSSVEVPSSLIGLSNSGAYTVSGNGNGTLAAGSYKFSSMGVSGNGQLTLQGPMEIYLTEIAASALAVSGNGRVCIQGEVKIYTEGKCNISGNGIANTSNLPKDFTIYSRYAGTDSGDNGVQISGNSDLYGAIYAPDTKVSVSGNGDIYGSIIGDEVYISGNGDVHYDEDLANAGGGGGGNYAVGSWREEKNSYSITP